MTRHETPPIAPGRRPQPAFRARLARLRAEPEAGSVVVELILVVPVFIVLMLFIVALGRASDAGIEVQDAAHAAARAATLAASPGAAESAAQQAAAQALAESGTTCRSVNVTADVGGLTPGSLVQVTVSCTVNYQDLSGFALPGARTISSTSSSVVDLYGTTGTGTD
jgi:Flp pilus assembly protein TadG